MVRTITAIKVCRVIVKSIGLSDLLCFWWI